MAVQTLGNADVLHENSGQANDAASSSVNLTGAVNGFGEAGTGSTTSGTKLILLVHAGAAMNTPTGFTLAGSGLDPNIDQRLYWFWKDVTGVESSWTLNVTSGTTAIQWVVWEVQRLAAGAPLTTTALSALGDAGLTSLIGPVTGSMTRNDCFVVGSFALAAVSSQANMASLTLSPNTSLTSYAKLVDVRWATETTQNFLLAAARGFSYPLGQLNYGLLVSGNGSMSVNDYWAAGNIAFASLEAGRADPLDFADGFEYGITPNTAAPTTATRMLDILNGTWGTQVAVSSAAPRSGTYHMRVTQSAAAGRAGQDTNTLGTSKDDGVLGAGFKINSSTGTVVLAEIAPASGTILQLVYDTSTTQLGVRWGAGTIAYQQDTTATGSYVWVDLSADGFTGTTRTARWSLNGQEQDAPANLTAQTASSLLSITYGLNASQTVTFDVDDWCLSTSAGDYPLGPHNVRLLTVDPAGTVTADLSGAAFNVFTANGTLAAWTATGARGAVDEVPPTISATADGLVQVTAQGSYVKFPMDTYTLAAGEVIDYVGAVFALWANSTQTANIELSTATAKIFLSNATSFNPGNAAQPASATVPTWVRGKWDISVGWTQTLLNNATIWVGNSTDATPDIGVHVIYLLVAVRERLVSRIYGPDDDGVTVDATRSGVGTIQSYFVTAGATRAATVSYVKDGVETSQAIDAGATATITTAANFIDQVTRVTVESDPLPAPEL